MPEETTIDVQGAVDDATDAFTGPVGESTAPEGVVQEPTFDASTFDTSSVLTSEPARDEAQIVDNFIQGKDEAKVAAAAAPTPPPPPPEPPSETFTPEERDELGIPGPTQDEIDLENAQKDIDDAEKGVKDALDDLSKNSDDIAKEDLANIEASFTARANELRSISDKRIKGLSVLGIRSGRSQFAPEIQSGIISGEERALVSALEELDLLESQAISGVKSAQASRDYEAASIELGIALDLADQKRATLKELQDVQFERDKVIAEEIEMLETQSDIIDVVNGGITDPTEVFIALAGSVSFDDIVDVTNSLPKTEADQFTLSKGQVRFDSSGNVIATGGGVSPSAAGGSASSGGFVSSGNVISSDGRLEFNLNEVPEDANLLTVQIGPKIYGGRISNDESKRIEDLANKGIAAGQTTAEIMDAILGYTPSKNKAFANSLRDVLLTATNQQDGLADFDMVGLARLIENDDLDGAIRKVEATVMRQARKDDPSLNMSESTARVAAQQTSDLNEFLHDLIEDPSDKKLFGADEFEELPIGVIEGTFENWLGRFREEESSQIKTRITELVAKMRNDLLGSAVTETEEKFIEPMIPKLSDRPDVFMDKLTRLSTTPLLKLNQTRDIYGLPTLSTSQLLDVNQRVPLYQSFTDTRNADSLSSTSNSDLQDAIDRALGETVGTSGVDINGFPI
jgi:hypothetical protein